MSGPGRGAPVVVMPVMSADQEAAWNALLDLHERVPRHWTLVGGQMVHLWCAERGWPQPRPTDDADAVVDVRADPNALPTFAGARHPSLFGALVMKAAAHGALQGSARGRHRYDLALLASVLARRDVAVEEVARKDTRRLRTMIEAVRSDAAVMAAHPQAREARGFLEGALR